MSCNNNTINDVDMPEKFIEISNLFKLNQKKTRRQMLKLLHQNFSEDCEENEQKIMTIFEYAVFLGEKLYRSFFIRALGETLEVGRNKTAIIANIIELMYICMLMQTPISEAENDDFINGRETCNKKFGTAQTVIAANSLSNLIIEILLDDNEFKITDDMRCKIVKVISKYSGKDGISGGQMMKVLIKKQQFCTDDEDTRIKKLKVNSLFNAGAECIEVMAKTTMTQNTAIKSYINNFCNLINLYEDIDNRTRHEKEILQRADMFTEQGGKSISKIKNSEKLIRFIEYNNYCIHKIIDETRDRKPIVITSDVINA